MIKRSDVDLFRKSIIAQDDDNDYSESGWVAVLVNDWAALTKYGHCSCFDTWASITGGDISDTVGPNEPRWDWTGNLKELIELARFGGDPALKGRKAESSDYDYDHLMNVYKQILDKYSLKSYNFMKKETSLRLSEEELIEKPMKRRIIDCIAKNCILIYNGTLSFEIYSSKPQELISLIEIFTGKSHEDFYQNFGFYITNNIRILFKEGKLFIYKVDDEGDISIDGMIRESLIFYKESRFTVSFEQEQSKILNKIEFEKEKLEKIEFYQNLFPSNESPRKPSL